MAAGRLMFLYLLRAAARGIGSPSRSGAVEAGAARGWARRSIGSFAKRHGKAIEPTEWEKQQQQKEEQQPQKSAEMALDATTQDGQPESDIGKLFFQDGKKKAAREVVTNDAPEPEAAALKPQGPRTSQEEAKPQEPTTAGTNVNPSSQRKQASSAESAGSVANKPSEGGDERPKQAKDGAKKSDMLETVFLMGAPENVARQQTPSLSPPKYVHHFDSYSLVKHLQEGGYTEYQAITIMKAIRGILAHNLDMAQESLVSKSDVENESYLFSAACSELSAEIRNNRRVQDEQMRQQRTHLQHEIDILTQSLNQELLTLTDNVRGAFNNRKMAVREEQKSAESAIQKISYKMSIMLSSDSKSEIEGVRWILIRRSVLGIIFMAILTLGTIRYATYVSHENQREADHKKKLEEELRRDGGKSDHTSAPDAAAIFTAS